MEGVGASFAHCPQRPQRQRILNNEFTAARETGAAGEHSNPVYPLARGGVDVGYCRGTQARRGGCPRAVACGLTTGRGPGKPGGGA